MSFSVLRKDKEILLLPLISGVFLILIWVLLFASIVGAMFLAPGVAAMLFSPPVLYGWPVLLFILYVISYFIVIYFNAAVIACAMIRLNGGDPTVRDGLQRANQHLGKIFAWALVSATIGLILQAISRRAGFAGRIAIWLIGVAWSVATYFVVPVLIFENEGAWGSLKKSANLFKNTFGTTMVSSIAMGLIFFGLALIGLVPLFFGIWAFISLNSVLGLIVGIAVAFVYWIIIACVSSAAQGVLVAALYRYATTGKIAPDFAPFHETLPRYTTAAGDGGKNW